MYPDYFFFLWLLSYSIRIGNLDWYKCQKQPLKVFCEKRCSLKFCKIYRKHLWGHTYELWEIFKKIFFTEQLRTTSSEMRALQKRSERNRLSLLYRGGCNAYCFGWNFRMRGKHLFIQLLWACARLSVKLASLKYRVHEFFLWLLV